MHLEYAGMNSAKHGKIMGSVPFFDEIIRGCIALFCARCVLFSYSLGSYFLVL